MGGLPTKTNIILIFTVQIGIEFIQNSLLAIMILKILFYAR